MVERQIQYTHTHFCYLVLKKKQGEGQDTVVSPAPVHPEFNDTIVFTVMKEANLVHLNLAHRNTQLWCSRVVTKSAIPKYCLEAVLRFCSLTTTPKSLLETNKQKWQFGIIQFLGVISTISVSLLSMRIMLQHITPLAYGSVKLSVVRFHHLSPTHLFLKTKQPFLQLTFIVTSHCVWNIKKTWSHLLIMPLLRLQRLQKNPQVLRHCVRLVCHDSREEQDCSSVQSCGNGLSSTGNGIPQ